jgi:excisionase family DNA binding protein
MRIAQNGVLQHEPGPRRVYTINEAAAELRVSRRTIERRIADGSLPCSHKLGVPRIPATAIAEAAGESAQRSRRIARAAQGS